MDRKKVSIRVGKGTNFDPTFTIESNPVPAEWMEGEEGEEATLYWVKNEAGGITYPATPPTPDEQIAVRWAKDLYRVTLIGVLSLDPTMLDELKDARLILAEGETRDWIPAVLYGLLKEIA